MKRGTQIASCLIRRGINFGNDNFYQYSMEVLPFCLYLAVYECFSYYCKRQKIAHASSMTTMTTKKWFVLRDLTKSTTKGAAYIELPKLGIRCFTPMCWVMSVRGSVRKRKYVPVVRNLLFVYESRLTLDPIIVMNYKLQYLYARGGAQATPMTVSDQEMERFINAVNNDDSPIYFTPQELTADMLGKEIIVKGGPLDGYSGRLLKLQGSKKKRLVVEIKGFMAAAVEINPDFIQLL